MLTPITLATCLALAGIVHADATPSKSFEELDEDPDGRPSYEDAAAEKERDVVTDNANQDR